LEDDDEEDKEENEPPKIPGKKRGHDYDNA
jgi:hypothetical protein